MDVVVIKPLMHEKKHRAEGEIVTLTQEQYEAVKDRVTPVGKGGKATAAKPQDNANEDALPDLPEADEPKAEGKSKK